MGTKIQRRERRLSLFVVAFLLVIPFGGVAHAADGDLDGAFGGDGKVTTTFPGGAYAQAVAIQPDGKIVAVGAAAGESAAGEFALARYETDGTLDATFGTDGRVTTAVSGDGGGEARAVAIQSDGKIVAAGTVNRETFALARYDPDGTLDATFGSGGIVTTDLTPRYDIAYGVVIQPDGKIVAVGMATPGSVWRPAWALVRYDPGGTLDPSFGSDGMVVTKFGVWGEARAVALQANGKIVAVGTNGRGFALARYLPDGTLDASFGNDGKVGRSFDGGWANAVALQPDGKIVAAGDYEIFSFAVARYTARGELDPTFGGDGRVTTDVGTGEQGVAGLVIQPSGKIVAAGSAGPHEYGDPTVWRFVLTRYRANGALDPKWGGDGRVITKFKGGAGASGVAVQTDGKIVVVGGAGESNAEAFALARYLA